MTRTEVKSQLLAALNATGGGSSDFDLDVNPKFPPERLLRPAAVLVPILLAADTPRVILTKRASGLKHHPGQIAFPGGKVDPNDHNAQATALREAHEEIGLIPSAVEVLGHLPDHETVTGFSVTPVIGLIQYPVHLRAEPGETEEIFSVPLAHVVDRSNYAVQSRHWRKMARHYYTVPYGPYYIWGATARMLRGLAERIGE